MKSALKRALGGPALTGLAASRLSGSVLILGYHDVSADDAPGHWLRVRQREFDRQLAWLGRMGGFVGPDELPGAAGAGGAGGGAAGDGGAGGGGAGSGGGPPPARREPGRGLRFLITFDDGYVNNHRLALPVLEAHGAPALFLVSTRHAQTGEPFWFDRVAVPIQAEARAELDLRDVGLAHYRFRPGDGPGRWDDIQRLLVDIKALGNPGQEAVDRVLRRCEEAAGERGRAALRDCRPLNVREIRAMRAGGLCHFGSHAHAHEILTYLDDAALAASLRDSRAFLAEALGVPPRDVAYPNGDADARVFAAARAAGYARGYTIETGVARAASDPLRLPRLLVGGYDTAAVLAYKLNRVLLRAAFR